MKLNDRAKLRASQERRLEHAYSTIAELIKIHMPEMLGERETSELFTMKQRLLLLIKHQHVKDREFAGEKMTHIWEEEGY